MTKVRANIGAYSIVGFLVSFDLIRLSREGEAIVQILYFETGEAPFVKLAAILFVAESDRRLSGAAS